MKALRSKRSHTYYDWTSCFYAGAVYGFILLAFVSRLPETLRVADLNAFKLKHLFDGYANQFKNKHLILGGLLMGSTTCFIYVFAALAPFIAMNIFGMSSAQYGAANVIPPMGLILGSLIGAQLSKRYSLKSIIQAGVGITSLGVILMLAAMLVRLPILFSLFLPMIIVYFGLCFIMANASSIAMSHVEDKAHGSAVMNFVNMGLATLVVLSLSLFPTYAILLPIIYVTLCVAMVGIFQLTEKYK